jgi:membrane-anchored protein YejM (alkaline phosphatase superfamily)
LGAMQDQIRKYATNRSKFFLTYVPVAPHNPFDAVPDRFQKLKMSEFGDYEPSYINQLTYMDWIEASILDELKTNGLLDNTLVIIMADHGEMLGINGGPIGHGWELTPELANVPLIIMDPGNPGYRVNRVIGSQVDLFPTVMDILGMPMPTQNLYQGISLLEAQEGSATNRLIYLSSLRQYAVINGNKIICGDRETEAHESEISRKVYEITNSGTRTDFNPQEDESSRTVPLIFPFDTFQENFLHNYSRYCQMIEGDAK